MAAATGQQDKLQKEIQELVKDNRMNEEELKYLRETRTELTKEREELVTDLKGHQTQIEEVYKINKELKNKIKRLEHLLYGKNMNGPYKFK